MDPFTSLKRKELQKLAKKHGLRANAKTEDIIKDLNELLNAKKPDNEPKQVDEDRVNTSPADSDIPEHHEENHNEEDDFMAVSKLEEKTEPLAPLYPDLTSDITTNTTTPSLYPVLTHTEPESVPELDSVPESDIETPKIKQKTTESKKIVANVKPTATKKTTTTLPKAKTTKAEPETRRQNIIQQKKTTRTDDIKERQKGKKSVLAAVNNKVSGANRPTKPKVKQTAENVAKAAATQKAKDKIKKKGMIDFDKIHAKQFNKLASIAQHQKSKDSRLDVLYGGLPRPSSLSSSTPNSDSSATTTTSTTSDSTTTPSTSSSSSSSSTSSTGFSFKPPTFQTSKGAKNTPTTAKSKKSKSSSISSSSTSSTPAKSTTSSTSSTPSTVNRLTDTKRTAPVTIPAFVLPSSTSSSVFSKVKETNLPETSKTPKQQKPKPVFNASKTPLKPTTTESKKQTPAPKRTNPTTDSTSTSPSAPSTEPPKKKVKPDPSSSSLLSSSSKPASYTPHSGPIPKFENSFSSFSPAPSKVAVKPKYDARKSLAMSAKKTPKSVAKKSAAVIENNENVAVNSIVC